MRGKIAAVVLMAGLFCAAGQAQDTQSGFTGQVPVNVALKKSLSSADAKVGQEISAVTEKPVTINGTQFPRGSVLLGHVVDVTKHTKENPNGSLTIVFDHAQPKKGDAIAIRSSVYQIALSDSQIQGQRRDVDMGMRGSAAEMNTTSAVREGTDQDSHSVQGSVSAGGAPVRVVSAIPGVALSAVASDEKSGIMSSQNKDVELASGTEMVIGVAAK
jgi:hypothetical protein